MIAVTGATGHLGRLVVESLLERGTPADQIVAAVRTPAKASDLAERGVQVREADYSRPETLAAAFAGVDTLLLVSSSEVGQRVPQHVAVIDAAKAAGVGRLVYTSASQADTSTLVLAPDHKATEEYLAQSGLVSTVLRNNWYIENYAQSVQQARETGEILASVGDGRVASATRAEYAEAAAVVLVDDSHAGKVYELTGDVAWTHDELAAAASEVLGREVSYHRVSPEEHATVLSGFGLDEGTVGFVVALDGNIRDGELATVTDDLSTLLRRPTLGLVESLRTAV